MIIFGGEYLNSLYYNDMWIWHYNGVINAIPNGGGIEG